MPIWKIVLLVISLISIPFLVLQRWYVGIFPISSFILAIAWGLGFLYWTIFLPTTFLQFAIVSVIGGFIVKNSVPLLNRLETCIVQGYRNRKAIELAEGYEEGLVLFLRPFAVDGELGLLGISAKWVGVDFETVLTYASKPVGDLVALGRPDDAFGAGRLETAEANWFGTFIKMARRARLIVVIPSANRGTTNEVRWLISECKLGQTIFVMPTLTTYGFWESPAEGSVEKSYATQWAQVVPLYASLGLNMPPYTGDGALFMMDGQGNPRNLRSLGGSPLISRWMMRRYFRGAWARHLKNMAQAE